MGQFARGNSGRPKGARRRVAVAVDQLFEAGAQDVARVALELARAGDVTAVKLVLDRVAPVRRGAPLRIANFPKIAAVADIPPAIAFLSEAVTRGEISPDEAAAVGAILNQFITATEMVDLATRLDAIEAAIEENKK